MRVVDHGEDLSIQPQSGDSQELVEIALRIMPDWLRLFAKKNADYGSGSAFELGERGQYSDIHRKMIKLKRAMWDGEELDFEGTDEIIKDLIGHLFLTLYMRDMKEEAARAYAYTEDDAAVDTVFRLVGGDASKAYQMSYGLNPPFGDMVRARASKMMEDEAREEMAARGVDPSISLETATQRLRDAGMTNEQGEPLLMTRPQLLHHTTASGFASASFGEADQAQHLAGLRLKAGDILTISGLPKADGDYKVDEAHACSSRGKGFDGPACRCHDNEGYSIRPLRDDDPVHPQGDEDEEVVELADFAEKLTPEQLAEVKPILDKLFKNSDKQRELLSKFERKVRGY